MFDYLVSRLTEKSTFAGLATSVSALVGISFPDEKVQAAFMLLTFVLGLVTAAMKEKGE